MNRKLPKTHCRHLAIKWASGDYYLICCDCDSTWVMTKPGTDVGSPEEANQGPGISNSGDYMLARQ
jgi:hypothetical protein